MVRRIAPLTAIIFYASFFAAQLPVARDTIMVMESNRVLKMPWAGGINQSNISSADLNNDGLRDLVVFDRQNYYGRFRCFINKGAPGEIRYQALPELSSYFPQVSNWALMLDYDNDGKEDLFTWTSGGIKVYRNSSQNGSLAFTLAKDLLKSNYTPGSNPSVSNIFASPVGVPGIADVDNDGDPDILTFSPGGSLVEYHRNLGNNGLEYELGHDCWGDFLESDCKVEFNYCTGRHTSGQTQRPLHEGSCITCVDSDGDGDKDIIMGDVGCNQIIYIHNGGTAANAVFTDTTKLYPNFPQKNNTVKIHMNNFPCAYHLDVDNDGKKDLIATPNADYSENYKSLWLYRNSSNTNTVNFQFMKYNFLQDEMIEVGQNSFPVLFDYNADGLKDLLIGTYGYYESGGMVSRLTLYKNTGTASIPSFSLITRDFTNLSTYNLNIVIPAPGDIDGDGDTDLCIGVSTGQVHWLENTAGAGNPCNFSQFKINPFSFTTMSGIAAPQIFDLDEDGKPDLLIGTKDGKISWYRNTGVSTPTFSLMSSYLGGVDVKANPVQYGLHGYAAPYFYKEGNVTNLLVGSITGAIFHYTLSSPNGSFTLINKNVNGINDGAQSSVWFEDINNDGKRDLLLGNISGGLSFYSSDSPNVGISETDPAMLNDQVRIFPNPVKNILNIEADLENPTMTVDIFDISGKKLNSYHVAGRSAALDISWLEQGLYFLKIRTSDDHYFTKKLVRSN